MRTGRPPKTAKIVFTCGQCGNTWEAYAWENDRSKYCSRICFYQSRVGRPKVLRRTPERRPCLRCGKIFLVGGEGNRAGIAKYCSRICARHGFWGEAVHKPARQMAELETAWFAGFFEGEGCIRWGRRTVVKSFALTLTNTNKSIMEKIIIITGTGRITERLPKNPRHSMTWTWQCYGDNARSLLKQVLPWLIIKREAAEAALGINKVIEPPWTQRSKTMRAAALLENQ